MKGSTSGLTASMRAGSANSWRRHLIAVWVVSLCCEAIGCSDVEGSPPLRLADQDASAVGGAAGRGEGDQFDAARAVARGRDAGRTWDAAPRVSEEEGCSALGLSLRIVEVYPEESRGIEVPEGGTVICPVVVQLIAEVQYDTRVGHCGALTWEYSIRDPKTRFSPYVYESWQFWGDGTAFGAPDRISSEAAFLIFTHTDVGGRFEIRLRHSQQHGPPGGSMRELGSVERLLVVECGRPQGSQPADEHVDP